MHLVVSCYPVLVDRNVLGVEELATRTVLPWSDVDEEGEKARRKKKGGRESSRKRDKPIIRMQEDNERDAGGGGVPS